MNTPSLYLSNNYFPCNDIYGLILILERSDIILLLPNLNLTRLNKEMFKMIQSCVTNMPKIMRKNLYFRSNERLNQDLYCNLPFYLELLGVGKSSDQKEIKKAYYKLAQEYHPDKNPSP